MDFKLNLYYFDIYLMPEQNLQIPDILKIKKQSLDKSASVQETILNLQEISIVLQTLDISSISKTDLLLFDYLKPISRQATNLNISHKNAKAPIKKIILMISRLYAKVIRNNFSLNAFEMITELLQRHSEIFRKNSHNASAVQEEMQQSKQQQEQEKLEENEWVKVSSYSSQTTFFYQCVLQIMKILNGIENSFVQANLNFVKEFLSFLYYMEEYLKRAYLNEICQKFLSVLEQVFSTAHTEKHKEFCKDINFDTSNTLMNAALKVLKISASIEFKKKYQILGSLFGMSLLKNSTSIEKKIQGLKNINQWANYFYANPISYIKEEEYCRWMLENGIMEIVYEDPTQLTVIKASGDIIKLFVRKKCLSEESFKKLFDFISKGTFEVRQNIFKYIDHASTRFDYADYELIINRFLQQTSNKYHLEEAFNLLQSVGRYATYTQNSRIQKYLSEIIYAGQFKNSIIQNKCVQLYITTFGRVLERNRETDKKINDFFDFVEPYLVNPSSLGVILIKKGINKLPDVGILSRSKACHNLIVQKDIVSLGLKWLDELKPNSDVEELISYILQNAKQYYYSKAKINDGLYYKATKSPKIFQKLVTFLESSLKVQQLFETMVSMFAIQKFPFVCLRILFFRLNQTQVYDIIDAENQHDLRTVASSLKGFENLKYLLLNATNNQARAQVAQFIAELYTIFSQDIVDEGERELKKAMKETIYLTLQEYNKNESPEKVLSYLYYIEYLMQVTELFGVGDLKSHNSLVPTSTITVKIFNEITFGSDVQKVFEKKVPSNISLFQLIEELSKQFKCSPSEIMFREGAEMWPQRLNGLTLQQLNINGKAINAVKSFRNKIRKQPLIHEGQLSEKAKNVFEQIYNSFAVEGKMGKKECANYVAGVTKTSCTVGDPRVSQFFRDYDQDKDDNITLEDFIKFYKLNASSYRDDIVWKNLSIMRYRKDLKKYDEPIEKPPLQLIFRHHLSENPQIYKMLFALTQSQNPDLREKAMTLLFRLPTFKQTVESFSSSLNLEQKNSFKTQYLLIAIQSYLSFEKQKEERRKKFIQSGHSNQIFEMMIRISQIQNPQVDEIKCLFISLQILRLLIEIPNLRNQIQNNFILVQSLKLPETDLFIKIAKESLPKLDIQILQSSLALQFTQQNINLDFVLQFIFNEEFQIRRIACNYVFVAYKIQRIGLNLFSIQPQNFCQYWFEILIKIIFITPSLDFPSIINHSLSILNKSSEDIEKNPDDSIIYGNLSILTAVFYSYPTLEKPKDFTLQLVNLAKRLISIRNRKMLYNLMSLEDPSFAIQYISALIKNIEPCKQVSIKKNFVGIKNLGAICYMNSIIQQLFSVIQFRNLIISLDNNELQLTEVDDKMIYDDILYQLQKMYTYLQKSKRQYYNPQQFCLTIKDSSKKPINIRIQEDAHEFVSSFFDKLEPYMEKNHKLEEFDNIFGGKTLTQFTCDSCSNKIQRDESFIQLSLEVKNIKELQDSFSKFIQPEAIDDYFCEACDKRVQKITKQTFLSCLPKILIINLQRIVFELETFQKVKIDTSFSFPHQINLFSYVFNKNIKEEDCEYELKGVVIHSGTSQSGHYYSIIRQGKEWYKFNDQTVSKFDSKDIPREAFGGSDTTDQWNDELKFSTNAYILFYEKKEEMKPEITCHFNENFNNEVEKDNEILYHQVQVHQESIFEFANNLYEKIRPQNIQQMTKVKSFDEQWQQSKNLQKYKEIFPLLSNLLIFARTFYDIKAQHFFKLGKYLYELYYLLPEQSYTFLMQLDPEYCLQTLALHNDDNNRNIFKCILNKILHVYFNYYSLSLDDQSSQQNKKIKALLDHLFEYMKNEKLSKNIFKSTQYFQFWKDNCQLIYPIYVYSTKRQILVNLVDILMANDSPLAEKGTKRQQIPQYQAIPIIHLIYCLMSKKKNLKDYLNPNYMVEGVEYLEMTQNEKKMLGNIKFYRKMIKNRNDNGLLSTITGRLSEKDLQFSKAMVELFLKGLNSSYDELQSSLILINHLKFYLLIEDQYTINRIKWVMGIPQLQIGDQNNYGLKYADQSTVYSYVSPLFFIQSDHYQPALQVLFLKKSIYTQFSIAGVKLLLELLCYSDTFFNYLMSIPAPNYILRHYADWIEEYIKKLNEEQSYYFQFDKNASYNQLSKTFAIFDQKLNKSQKEFPVNPYVVGKNKNMQMKDSAGNGDYEMALWAHQTYVLKNQPTGYLNKSLPKELFKFAEPQGFAVNFVNHHKKMVQDEDSLETRLSQYTLQIDSKKKMKLNFSFKNFNEEIFIDKGQVKVTFPYQEFEGPFSQFIQVTPIQQEHMNNNIIQEMKEDYHFPSILDDNKKYDAGVQFIGEKSCSTCTFVNFGRQTCQMCETPLY